MAFISNAFYENLKMALATLRNNKLRSFLTIFGVIVGVLVVMLISSIISGIDLAVKKQIESFGTRSIFLRKFDIKAISNGRRTQEERMRKPLTTDDLTQSQIFRRSKFQFRSSTLRAIFSVRKFSLQVRTAKRLRASDFRNISRR